MGSREPLKVFIGVVIPEGPVSSHAGEDREPSSDLSLQWGDLSAEPAAAASGWRGPALVGVVSCVMGGPFVLCRGQAEQFLAADCGREEAGVHI